MTRIFHIPITLEAWAKIEQDGDDTKIVHIEVLADEATLRGDESWPFEELADSSVKSCAVDKPQELLDNATLELRDEIEVYS